MNAIRHRGLLVLVATGLASLAASVASAQNARISESVVVRYQDLDLSQSNDAQKLYSRIKTAAELACGDANNNELVRMMEQRACVKHAVADAVAKVNSARLTTIYQAQTRRI